jgi:predicted protein tyrosine phosphatase
MNPREKNAMAGQQHGDGGTPSSRSILQHRICIEQITAEHKREAWEWLKDNQPEDAQMIQVMSKDPNVALIKEAFDANIVITITCDLPDVFKTLDNKYIETRRVPA